ncbi:MAG TPA: hypothetical protein VNW54_15720 [Granulicella sp.]|jgi:hypothetical protein|nr:hypothetical protein [Granulicella sp.]
MQRSSRLFSSLRASAALTFFCGAATLGLQAQPNTAETQSLFSYTQPVRVESPKLLASLTADAPSMGAAEGSSLNYSSSAGAAETRAAVEGMSFGGADASPQPPPRRYGRRPVYADSSHNADGSNKYSFFGGIGFQVPTGNTHKYLTPSYSFQFGGGRNFNKSFGVMAQFDWDNLGFQGSTLDNQSLLYFGATGQGLDGSTHVWSFTLDPIYNYYTSEKFGAYVVGGVGFFHKVATFTVPAIQSTFYGDFLVNAQFDHYTSNAPGYDGGLGFTYKPSRFGDLKFYAEARYVFVDNQQRTGLTAANLNTTFGQNYLASGGTNFYPANSNRTTYIPVKFGVRF